jgi:hypothetical protein
MNLVNARRVLWVAAIASFAWLIVAYYDDRAVQIVIAAGLFVLAVPVDRLLHLEINTRKRHPSPFGPVNKFGMREEVFHTRSPYWMPTDPIPAERRPAEWWTERDLAEIMTAGKLEYSNRDGTRSIDLRPGAITRRRRPTWWRRILGHWFAWIVAVGLVLGYALYGSAQANATPLQDASFLRTLDSHGYQYASPAKVIGAAYEVCRLLDAGYTFDHVAVEVDGHTKLDLPAAEYFTATAISAYCVEHADIIPGSTPNTRT